MAQVVEHLPSKCKALSLYPSTTKNQRNRKTGGLHDLGASLELTIFLQDITQLLVLSLSLSSAE
jgi:hypothetical protein